MSATPQPWDALKNELEDLLGQVQDQITEIEYAPKPTSGARRAVTASGETDLETRRAAALANVRSAVARLDAKKEDEPKKKKKKKKNKSVATDLDAAIAQIRASTAAIEYPQHEYDSAQRMASPRHTDRYEQQEDNQIAQIVGQIEGLHRSVRDLTGSLSDRSQFERIETQIGDLANQISKHSSPQADAISDQLDGLQYALERLAELQIRQIGHIEQLKDHQPEPQSNEQAERLETSIRAIYDKFDLLEQSIDRPNSSIETIAKGIASIARAVSDIQKRGQVDHGPKILSEIEDVARRLQKLEQPNANQARLSDDVRQEMHGLRGQLVNALEPRFTALESRLDDFAANMGASGDGANHGEIFSRLEGFEDRLTAAIERVAQVQSGVQSPNNAVTIDALRSMEGRLADALKQVRHTSSVASNGESVSSEALEAMEQRISNAIGRLQQELPEVGARQVESLRSIESKLSTSLKKLETLASKNVGNPSPLRQVHVTSNKPNAELKFEPHPNAIAPRAELRQSPASKPAPEQPAKPVAKAEVPAPKSSIKDDLPPRPRSFLAPEEKAESRVDVSTSIEAETPSRDDERSASKDSFIAAARRAAQGRGPELHQEPKKSGGLLGKALARLKPTPKDTTTIDEAEAPAHKAPHDDQKAKPAKTPPTRIEPPVLAEKSESIADEAFAEEDRAAVLSVGPEPARPQSLLDTPKPRSILEMQAEEDEDDAAEPRESFLSRNRQPILLGASIIAIIAMTANLVMENNKPAVDRSIPQSEAQMDLGEAPRQISLSEVENALAGQNERMPNELAALTDGIGLSDQQVELVAPQPPGIDETTTASIPSSPVPVALPPAELGPEALLVAASNGDPRAQFEIGMIYAEGKAVGKDSQQAVVWFERSAAQGFANAQYRLGTAYEHGLGVEKDLEQAKLWYLRAAETGNRMSMHNLAALLASAPDDQRDFSGAARWFEEAAKRGVVDSQFNLGMLYARGLGVGQDFAESFKWFAIAAANGDKDAAKARDDVAKSIEAAQMSEVKEKLSNWRPEPIDLKANFAPIGTWAPNFDPGKEIAKKEIVLSVQIALSKLGFDLGQPDGLAGPKTRDAIRQFERALGMNESGQINPRLLTILSGQPV